MICPKSGFHVFPLFRKIARPIFHEIGQNLPNFDNFCPDFGKIVSFRDDDGDRLDVNIFTIAVSILATFGPILAKSAISYDPSGSEHAP